MYDESVIRDFDDEDFEFPWYEEYLLWPLERAWESFTMIPRRIKWFIQRGRRGYSDSDLWSLDDYLLSWLPPALRQFRDNLMSHPQGIEYKEWKKILTKMANEIESGEKLVNSSYGVGKKSMDKSRRLEKEFHRGMKRFDKYFFNLWD